MTGALSIHIQPVCAEHRYIRDKDTSTIVERPERLRALAVGIAAAIALSERSLKSPSVGGATVEPNDLVEPLDNVKLESDSASSSNIPRIVRHPAPLDVSFLHNPAVRIVHALEEDTAAGSGEEYLSQLARWVSNAESRIKAGESEIPDGEGLSQGDLYLCPRSLFAIAGALQTTCDAVDSVISSPTPRAFVGIRPPGHHCGSDEPAGFCWVNNVLVGAAHAYHAHGVNRAVIFDIDLHHGNGTQSIAWKINAETHRQSLEAAARRATEGPDSHNDQKGDGLQIFYGSLHDILSYPCEDGDPALTMAASVSLGAHGQYIENVHLQEWTDEEDFFGRLYGDPKGEVGDGYATRLFRRAREFLKSTSATPSKTMIYVSCGFDAGEHEFESMSRHNRRVPTTFYDRFARDATAFADLHSEGRLVGVLEGGYSDRALISGGMAWTSGMIGNSPDKNWWNVENLEKLESTILTPKRKPRASAPTSDANSPIPEPWIARTLSLVPTLDATFGLIHAPAPRTRKKPEPVPAGARMTLRDRNKNPAGVEVPESGTRKPKSMPASPPRSSKPVSSAKAFPPTPPPPQPLVIDRPPVASSVQGGEAEQVQDAGLPDPVVDEAISALQTLSLGQSGTPGPSNPEPLIIKLRRPKGPQTD
ncbi:hypothetical protein FS749_004052 [Ceratobasidium sp. UAMH 11750]|nr:hypothetical protein FS749_004052 [Ceratobasidium sp. UAMH 11750]